MRTHIISNAGRRPLISRPGGIGALLGISLLAGTALAQPAAWFADGYHGGIYGHYPPSFTQFIVDSLRANPDWKINLEIEPATWDFACTNTPEAYASFKELATDQSTNGRIEFINPAYGQSYLWNISGESIIQQFARGAGKIREHFPAAAFTTYGSEEPCFTSALPGILQSFGFRYAVLKNPNTCWGGYTRAHGGELVNWIGPDGTAIVTVPRYEIESLNRDTTWETIGNANSPAYVNAAIAAHIKHPVGFCLQDAGWHNGPWLGHAEILYQPSKSTLWRNYFENVADRAHAPDWKFSQEDVQVSLVWGAQVLQRIAQEVRRAENRIVTAEKMATLAGVCGNEPWPDATLDESWRTLLLAQHHDCWITPYNGTADNTWADKVAAWTANTCRRSDEVIGQSMDALNGGRTNGDGYFIRIFNTLGNARTNLVAATLPDGWPSDAVKITDATGKEMPIQAAVEPGKILFEANSPSLGFSTYRLEKKLPETHPPAAMMETNGLVTIETDYYTVTFDRQRGGTISSLIAKKLGGRELVETKNARRFNEIRGYFFERGRFFSNADRPAKIELLENGPVRIRVRVTGQIESNSITQTVTFVQGEPCMDFSVRIDWRDRPGIGADYSQHGGFRREDDRKAFYDDRYKLLATLPLNLPAQRIFKDAPFDVTESRLTDTFFENWSAIKHNIILDWVDACDGQRNMGVTLLTDHTTSYTHDTNHCLGLTLQYAGIGLWGRDYAVQGATEVHYALLPHLGDWEGAGVWNAAKSWNEPLMARTFQAERNTAKSSQSLLHIEGDSWEIPVMRLGTEKVFVRLFNPSANASTKIVHYSGPVSKVEMVQLNGQVLREIPFKKTRGETVFKITLPPFGIGTLQFTPVPDTRKASR